MNSKNIISILVVTLLIAGLFSAALFINRRNETNPDTLPASPSVEPETKNGESVVLHFFWTKTCPFCLAQKSFLELIAPQYPSLEIKSYDLSTSQEHLPLFYEMAEAYGIKNPGGVPMSFISDKHFIGFAEDPIGQEIIETIEHCLIEDCIDPISRL